MITERLRVFVGALLLSEPITLRMIVAMIVILAGVAVIQGRVRLSSRAA